MRKTAQHRADQTRRRILEAAIREFSEHGLAGARTVAIARAAQVNKALLYYYFQGKEALYAAALEDVAAKVAENTLAVLDMACSPGERVLRFALQHFDRILGHQGFQALLQQEMIRYHQGRGGAIRVIAKKGFAPMFARVEAVVREGIGCGELCDVDWMQMVYSVLGANVFYFFSAPVIRFIAPRDPLEPASVAARRQAAIEFLGQSIFVDRRQGARLARRVLAAVPMPESLSGEKQIA